MSIEYGENLDASKAFYKIFVSKIHLWWLLLYFILDKALLKMVRSVSEDKLYNTIEFNEFLLMMEKQQETEINMDGLMEAFK